MNREEYKAQWWDRFLAKNPVFAAKRLTDIVESTEAVQIIAAALGVTVVGASTTVGALAAPVGIALALAVFGAKYREAQKEAHQQSLDELKWGEIMNGVEATQDYLIEGLDLVREEFRAYFDTLSEQVLMANIPTISWENMALLVSEIELLRQEISAHRSALTVETEKREKLLVKIDELTACIATLKSQSQSEVPVDERKSYIKIIGKLNAEVDRQHAEIIDLNASIDSHLLNIAEQEPQSVIARAMKLESEGLQTDAVSILRDASLKMDHNLSNIYDALAKQYFRLRAWDDCVEVVVKMVTLYTNEKNAETLKGINQMVSTLANSYKFYEANIILSSLKDYYESLDNNDFIEYIRVVNNIASNNLSLENYTEAVDGYSNSLSLCENLAAHDKFMSQSIKINLAVAKAYIDDYREAEDLLNSVIEVYKAEGNFADSRLADALASLAQLLIVHGEVEMAESMAEQAAAINMVITGEFSLKTAYALSVYGHVVQKAHKFERAESIEVQSIEIYDRYPNSLNSNLAVVLNNHVETLCLQDKFPEALPYAERAVSVAKDTMGELSSLYAGCSLTYAKVLLAHRKIDQAMRIMSEALSLEIARLGSENISVGASFCDLGVFFMDFAKRPKVAISYFERALSIFASISLKNSRLVNRFHYCRECYEKCVRKIDRFAIPADRTNQILLKLSRKYGLDVWPFS